MTNAQKDSSIEAPTPNMFFSSYSPTTSIIAIANVLAIGFSRSKHTIKRGITTYTSYSNVNQIPPSFPLCFKP